MRATLNKALKGREETPGLSAMHLGVHCRIVPGFFLAPPDPQLRDRDLTKEGFTMSAREQDLPRPEGAAAKPGGASGAARGAVSGAGRGGL